MGEGLRLGLVTYQLAKDWDLETIIANCREAGWEAVELRTEHAHAVEPELDAVGREDVRRRFAGSGVRLLSFGSTCEFHSPDPEEVRRQIERAKAFVDLAADVGAAGVKVRPNGLAVDKGVPEETTLRQIGVALRECGKAAQAKGVEIWLEVHGKETSEPRRIRAIMEHCDHPAVGVTWNCNLTDIKDGSVKESYLLLQPWVRVFHIQELWNPEYPWMELFETVLGLGFDGYALAEIPASLEPIRLMRYYKALFEKMVELARLKGGPVIRVAIVGCGAHAEAQHAVPLARYAKEHPGAVALVAAAKTGTPHMVSVNRRFVPHLNQAVQWARTAPGTRRTPWIVAIRSGGPFHPALVDVYGSLEICFDAMERPGRGSSFA